MTIEFSHLETNRPASDFTFTVTLVNNTYESPAMDLIPGPFVIAAYSKHNFVYDKFGFLNPGLGDAFQATNGYTVGIGNLDRFAGGAYYFLRLFPDPEPVDPIVDEADTLCVEPPVKGRVFWPWLSTFWDFLSTRDRETWEAFWDGLTTAAFDMNKKANRFKEVIAPEESRTCVLEDYYDIQIGPLFSRPTDLDPTLKVPNFVMRPLRTILITPTYVNGDPVFNDLIQLTARDYYSIREVGLEQYVVVQSKNNDINDKFFTVKNLLSSEEAQDRAASMEVNEDIGTFQITPSSIGRIRFTADDFMEDVSEYKILIQFDPAGPNSVTWTVDGYHAVIDSTLMNWEINDLIAASNTAAPNRWATLRNVSPKGNDSIPVFDDPTASFPGDGIKFENFPNYIHSEESDGRYYNIGGQTWKWFPDFGPSDGSVGDPLLGEYVDNTSEHRYIIEINGSLSYLGVEPFNTYFTTGLVYEIDTFVSKIPILQDGIDVDFSTVFKEDIDYLFYNNQIEFFENIFLKTDLKNGDYLWSPKTEVIESYLYERYGAESNVVGWQEFNYDNVSGRTGVAGVIEALQNSSDTHNYERAMNIYYGLPIAPDECDVIGLYESYLYEITNIAGDDITLFVPSGRLLHPFIQINTRIFPENKKEVKVSAIIDRSLGQITVEDASNLVVGDKVYIRLTNRYPLKGFKAEDKANEIPAYIDIFSPEGAGAIQHVIDILQIKTEGNQFPEILIYDTDKLEHDYNGVYHITEAEEIGGITRLHLYLPKSTDDEILYNDYIGLTTDNIEGGFAHISWPTHKFLYLFLRNERRYFKAYLDAPIDTIYYSPDTLGKYDVIARNIAVIDNSKFPGWEEFDRFRKQNGVNLQSDYVELTNIIPGAEFGKYFPSEFIDSILL